MHFATALEHTVNVVVYGEFETVLEIDKVRYIIYNFWWRPTIYHEFWHGTRWCVTTKWSLKTLYSKSYLRTRPLSCATHTTATNQGNIGSPCTWMRSQWSPNDHILQSPISTVCVQYCVAFLMFRCRNISMHAFARLFTSDLIANDCRVFDLLGALNKKMMKNICVC